MQTVQFHYDTGFLTGTFEDSRLRAVLRSKLTGYTPEAGEQALIDRAMRAPYGGKTLAELAAGKKKITVIISDHTRPVPSKRILPPMLRELRQGSPEAEITLLVATGCHRGTTKAELIAKLGAEIAEREHIVVHDCDDEANLVTLGTLPSGAVLRVNRYAAEADLLCAEGFIEPHFFAGFSGGRKSVLPGVCARKTVVANHCAAFIDDPRSRTGILEGNPIHRDMVAAAKLAGLKYIVNVVLDSAHKVIYAVAGETEQAHAAGCEFLNRYCRVEAEPTDIVITTNGGYPLDQNIYQAVKGMTAAEVAVKQGGVIIMLAASGDGHGGESFYRTFREEPDLERILSRFRSTPAEETIPDQWQSQIFARVMQKAKVIYVSRAPDNIVRDLHMLPARSLEEAMALAEQLLGNANATVTAIPDGVSVVVQPK